MANVTEPSRLDKPHRVRKTPKTRTCRACHKQVPDRGAPVCEPCGAELKTFRRYLRETLGLEPIHGDVPDHDRGERFRVWNEPGLKAADRGLGRR